MDVDVSKLIAGVAMLLTALNTLWLWHRSGRLPTEEALKDLDREHDKHGVRIQALESELKHLPTKDDVQKIQLSLTQMLGRMDVVSSELAGSSRAIRRMEDHIRGVGQ